MAANNFILEEEKITYSLVQEKIGEALKSRFSVSLPNATVIEENAFSCADNLETVIFGKNIKRIEEKAFYYCLSLEKIKLPKGVVIDYIGPSAFESTSLTGIITNVKEIAQSAFKNCYHLDFNSKICESIGDEAFAYTAIKKFCAPNIENLGERLFWGTMIEDVTIGTIKELPSCTLSGCNNLERLALLDGIETIKRQALFGISTKELTLPLTLKEIEDVNYLEKTMPIRLAYEGLKPSFFKIAGIQKFLDSNNIDLNEAQFADLDFLVNSKKLSLSQVNKIFKNETER